MALVRFCTVRHVWWTVRYLWPDTHTEEKLVANCLISPLDGARSVLQRSRVVLEWFGSRHKGATRLEAQGRHSKCAPSDLLEALLPRPSPAPPKQDLQIHPPEATP